MFELVRANLVRAAPPPYPQQTHTHIVDLLLCFAASREYDARGHAVPVHPKLVLSPAVDTLLWCPCLGDRGGGVRHTA